MAIDYNAGINSIDVGAHDITYSGNQGPKSPDQERLMGFDDTPGFELEPLEKLLEEYREDNNGRDPVSIDDLRRFFYTKYGPKGIAKVEQAVQQQEQQAQMQQREGIQMASAADPMLEEQYQQYVFEMEEQGLEPMSLEEFRQQAVAGMATGRRAGYKNGSSVQAGAVNYEPSEMVSVPTEFRAREHSPNTHLAYITNDEAGILQALKPDTPHIGPQGIPNYDSFDAQGVYTSSTGERSGGYDSKSQKSKEAQKKAKSAKPSKFIQEKIDKGEPTSIQTKEQEKQAAKDAKAFLKSKEPEKKTILQKATELGVTKFLPVIFERTIVRKINKERLEKVIIEAAEQSNRITVPSIEDPQKLKSFLNNDMDLIFTDLNTANTKIDLTKLTTKPTCVIIGPEGDFSEQEREEILKFNGVQSIKINENILRSETAVISALSIINYAIN